MGRDFDNGVFGEVLREDRKKQDQAKQDAQRAGRSTGGAGAAKRPTAREPDAFDQLGAGGKPDPDVRGGKSPGRVKLG